MYTYVYLFEQMIPLFVKTICFEFYQQWRNADVSDGIVVLWYWNNWYRMGRLLLLCSWLKRAYVLVQQVHRKPSPLTVSFPIYVKDNA